MGKLKEIWTSLTAAYPGEQLDEFYWAASIICSECGASDWGECEKCRVTEAKRKFTGRINKHRDVAKR